MNHFVVLERLHSRTAIIHDPARGRRKITLDQLSERYTGVVLELTPSLNFQPRDERARLGLGAILGSVTGLKRALAQLLFVGAMVQFLTLLSPLLLQLIVDEGLASKDRELLTVLGLGFLLLVCFQTLAGAARVWITTSVTIDLNFQWFRSVFGHLLRLPIEYFDNRHLGDITSRFGSIQAIQQVLTTQLVEVVIDAFLVLGALAIMFAYDATMALMALLAVLLYLAVRWHCYRLQREALAEQLVHSANQQTHFLETVRGVQSIRVFKKEEHRSTAWLGLLAEQLNATLKLGRITVGSTASSSFIFGVDRVIIIWLAAVAVSESKLSVGMLFAFLAYKDLFSGRSSTMIDKFFEIRTLRVHADRVADIVMTPAAGDNEADSSHVVNLGSAIELRNVSFRYSALDPWILRDINLKVRPGEFLAVRGASGCGKTTLIRLMLGLLTPTEGQVVIGGGQSDGLSEFNPQPIVASVMQNDHLFTGSVADNISFFDETPDMERIQGAAADAAIHLEIAQMPMGYNTAIGDLGSGFSGGQRQRLLLARALYQKPTLLFLDEATSHLDSLNESLISEAIAKMSLTRVVIAHRQETIASADRVLTLSNGAATLTDRP